MVDKNDRSMDRRKVLQISGAGLSALTGVSSLGTAGAERAGPQPVPQSDFEAHRAEKANQNTPQFVSESKIGLAKGGFSKQISQSTINRLYKGVFGSNLESGSIALPKPAKNEGGSAKASEKEGTILGVVVSLDDGQPFISVERTPPGYNPPNSMRRKAIEGEHHRLVDKKVGMIKNNGVDAIRGGVV